MKRVAATRVTVGPCPSGEDGRSNSLAGHTQALICRFGGGVHEMRMVLKDGRFLGARGAVDDEDLVGVGFNVSPVGAA